MEELSHPPHTERAQWRLEGSCDYGSVGPCCVCVLKTTGFVAADCGCSRGLEQVKISKDFLTPDPDSHLPLPLP
jgi:hypothetical protein